MQMERYYRSPYTNLKKTYTEDGNIEGNDPFRVYVNSTVSRWRQIMPKMAYSGRKNLMVKYAHQGQSIVFAVVNAHHKNVIKIHDDLCKEEMAE